MGPVRDYLKGQQVSSLSGFWCWAVRARQVWGALPRTPQAFEFRGGTSCGLCNVGLLMECLEGKRGSHSGQQDLGYRALEPSIAVLRWSGCGLPQDPASSWHLSGCGHGKIGVLGMVL